MEEIDGNSTPSSATPSSASAPLSQTLIRSKSDPAWAYISESRSNNGKKKMFICNFCAKVVKGWGIHRMKMHLASQRAEIGPCTNVPGDIRYRIQESLM